MLKSTTIDSFVKRKEKATNNSRSSEPAPVFNDNAIVEQLPPKAPRINHKEVDIAYLICDLGLHPQI